MSTPANRLRDIGGQLKTWFGTAQTPNLSDPLDPTEQVAPADRADANSDYTPSDAGEEKRLVDFVLARFADASRARLPVERDWVLGLAMDEGRQWLGWNDKKHRAESLMVEGEEHRYVTDNLTRPLLLKWQALVTMTRPDASPAPQTQADMDRRAASEARAILAHLDRKHRQPAQSLRRAYWCGACGVAWTKLYWEPTALADIPRFGPDGSLAGKESAPVGDVCREVISPFEVFLDPGASTWERCGYLFHAVPRPLSWFQERYGERGEAVEPDASRAASLVGDYVGAYLDAPSESSSRYDKAKQAVCYEYWERPSARFPQGRLVIVAGKILLHAGPLPYRHSDDCPFPFVRTVFQEAAGHAYGRGLVCDLAPLQVAYNRLLSRMIERTEEDKATLLLDKSSGIGADAYDDVEETRAVRKVWVNTGAMEPRWQPPPGLSGDNFRVRELVWQDMQHIAGIHDVNMGGTPTGVTAGISIELLQQGDRTQMGVFLQGLEQSEAEIGDWQIALYGQFASPHLPRLMGLDTSGNAQAAQMQAQSFAALTAGGACKIVVVPGSSTPKTAAGQNNEILEFFKSGLLDPTNPAAEIALSLMKLSRSDEVLERMEIIRAQMLLAAQAQQQQQAQQAQLMQAQAGPGGSQGQPMPPGGPGVPGPQGPPPPPMPPGQMPPGGLPPGAPGSVPGPLPSS